jgi:hypothetical protein
LNLHAEVDIVNQLRSLLPAVSFGLVCYFHVSDTRVNGTAIPT